MKLKLALNICRSVLDLLERVWQAEQCGRWVEGRQVKSLNAALVGMALAAGCFAHGHGDAATTTFEFECWLPATHVVVLNSLLPSHDEIIIHYILFPWRTTFSWV